MIPSRIELQIVTPERLVVSQEVDEVVLPAEEGSMGVLPGHAPLLTAIATGEIQLRVDGRVQYLAVSGGFAEILGHRVTVLAEVCEKAEEIDVSQALDAKAKAEAALKRAGLSDEEFQEAQASFRKALLRVQVGDRRTP